MLNKYIGNIDGSPHIILGDDRAEMDSHQRDAS